MKANRLIAAITCGLLAIALQISANVEKFAEIKAVAESGNADAQFLLGYRYLIGNGVATNQSEAAKWFREAANQGNVEAQHSLGTCYMSGMGIGKDAGEATKWWRKAAEQDHVLAQAKLGLCYSAGDGVEKDEKEALTWFSKAAAHGNAFAQRMVGIAFTSGIGTTKDTEEAFKWFRKCAEQADAQCQAQLGSRYAHGEGVPKDYVEAHKWLNLASAQGQENARQLLIEVENLMTSSQIADAQRLAREFKPRKPAQTIERIADSSPSGGGSGFFISEDGFLVTNEHVIRDSALIRVVTSAGLISAKVVKVDAANDLALLKAEGKFSALPLASSRSAKLGITVATVGFPNIGLQGFAPKLAKGEIASLSGAGDDARYFQISVPVQPGNSGGALVDERGNVVGVVSAKLNASAALAASGSLPENVNYAIKSSYLLSFLESVPEVAAKLKDGSTKEKKFEDVVKAAEQAAVLVLVY